MKKDNRGRARKTDEQFKEEVKNLVGYKYSFLEPYAGARTKILCKHTEEHCGYEYKVTPGHFLRGQRCPRCAKGGSEKKTNEEFIEEIRLLVGDEYLFLEDYKGARTKILCKHTGNNCNHEYMVTPDGFLRGSRCPKCAVRATRMTNEDFVTRVKDLVGDNYIFLEKYVNTRTKILCKHLEGDCSHEYMVTPNSFLRGSRCPKCSVAKVANSLRKTNEEFVKEVHALTSGDYIFLQDYIDTSTKILCKHVDNCGHEYKVSPNQFLRGSRCPVCATNAMKTNEVFIEQVKGLVGNNYIFLEEYKGARTKILCRHVSDDCNYEYMVTPDDFLSSGSRCPKCSIGGSEKKTNEEFVNEIKSLVGNEYLFLEKYKGARTKILCKHLDEDCGLEYEVTPDGFLGGSRCPICTMRATRKTNKDFVDEIKELVGDEYIFLEDYVNSRTELLCKHVKCGSKYKVLPSHFLSGGRCPTCAMTKGEEEVANCLINSGVLFQLEYSFPDLTGVRGGLLRFDFAIFDNDGRLSSLIEYDGAFHFERIYEDDGFEQIQIHDKRKNQYCKDNNIPLLRIPYWEFDNIEELVQEFLEQV